MKKILLLSTLILALSLAACSPSASSATAIPTVSVSGGSSSSAQTQQQSAAGSIAASAVVVPLNDTQLAFPVLGRVTAVNVKIGDAVKAGDVLVTLDTSIQEAKVREAEANLQAAEVQVKYLTRVGTDQKHLDLAAIDVQRAQALLDAAKASLQAQSGLTAPFDGTAVAVDVEPSQVVTPGQPIITLGDFSKFRIETTDLSEKYIASVKPGQQVTIFIEALGQEFNGRVAEISQTSSKVGGDVVFKVTIDFDQEPAGLLWGMSADVKIQTGG